MDLLEDVGRYREKWMATGQQTKVSESLVFVDVLFGCTQGQGEMGMKSLTWILNSLGKQGNCRNRLIKSRWEFCRIGDLLPRTSMKGAKKRRRWQEHTFLQYHWHWNCGWWLYSLVSSLAIWDAACEAQSSSVWWGNVSSSGERNTFVDRDFWEERRVFWLASSFICFHSSVNLRRGSCLPSQTACTESSSRYF